MEHPVRPPARERDPAASALRVGLIAFVVASVVFALWPQLDLAVSGFFARGADGFPLQHDPVIGRFNGFVLATSRILAVVLAGLALLSLLPSPRNRLAAWRRPLLLLAIAAAIGPGLIVNGALKEHVGRARPVHSTPFGGERHFTPAFFDAHDCDSNCSFVSGHTAGAMLPAGGYFIAGTRRRRRLWLGGGLAFAAVVGLARIAVGAHFLSDVVLAILITWLALAGVDALLRAMAPSRALARAGAVSTG